jgi:hypothetical protein
VRRLIIEARERVADKGEGQGRRYLAMQKVM